MMDSPHRDDGHHDAGQGSEPTRVAAAGLGVAAWLVGPAFFGLAAWLWLGDGGVEIPSRPDVQVDLRRLSSAPRRLTIGDPPTIQINSFERRCNDCHQIFEINEEQRADRMQHRHIELQHGINVECRHCHDVRDMNGLRLWNAEHVAYAAVDRLCAQCHPAVHDDWSKGIHGRIHGGWDPERTAVRRLGCIECHDPHRPRHPAMEPLAPLPGPHTLRMGEPADAAEAHHEVDPLRRAAQGLGKSLGEATHDHGEEHR